MYCEQCGRKRGYNELFCTECGHQYHESNFNKKSKSTSNTTIILGFISIAAVLIPFLSIPLAITSIIIGLKNKNSFPNIIPAIISLIISIIQVIIFISLLIFYNDYKVDISEDLFEEIYENEIIMPQYDYDIIGYDWLGDDNSLLRLDENGSYSWYQSEENHSENFYEGIYEIYVGSEAISYIANNLNEYNLTENDQIKNILASGHSINEYYLIILNCNKLVINGTEQTIINNLIYYYGYHEIEDNYLDLTNMNTQKAAGFTRKESINAVDINKISQF